jgi:hypothetical protein
MKTSPGNAIACEWSNNKQNYPLREGWDSNCPSSSMTSDFANIGMLKQFVQGGLIGNVTANLAAVFAQLNGTRITMSVYFFEEVAEADREYIEVAATQIVANFPEGYSIETRYGLLAEMELESTLNCVFLRAEAETRILDRRAGRKRKLRNGEDDI